MGAILPKEIIDETACQFNIGVRCVDNCGGKKCDKCGWNPDVSAARADIVRRRLKLPKSHIRWVGE